MNKDNILNKEEPEVVYEYINFNGMKCVTPNMNLAYARAKYETEVKRISNG